MIGLGELLLLILSVLVGLRSWVHGRLLALAWSGCVRIRSASCRTNLYAPGKF